MRRSHPRLGGGLTVTTTKKKPRLFYWEVEIGHLREERDRLLAEEEA